MDQTVNSQPTDNRYLDDKTLIHRFKMESELRTIQAQTFASVAADLSDKDNEIRRLQDQLSDLQAQLADLTTGRRVVDEEEYADLKDAEYHLRRVLHLINRSPFGWLARRRGGFQEMVDRWPMS